MPGVECPKCGEWVTATVADLERIVECRACGCAFPALDLEGVPEALDARRRGDYVRRLLQGPSTWLLVLSITSIAASCLVGAGLLVFGLSKFRILRGNSDAANIMLAGVVVAVAGALYFTPMLVGASLMRHPRHRFWPITACILAILSAVVFWSIPVLNLANGAFGIWALRRLYRKEVRLIARGDRDARR